MSRCWQVQKEKGVELSPAAFLCLDSNCENTLLPVCRGSLPMKEHSDAILDGYKTFLSHGHVPLIDLPGTNRNIRFLREPRASQSLLLDSVIPELTRQVCISSGLIRGIESKYHVSIPHHCVYL